MKSSVENIIEGLYQNHICEVKDWSGYKVRYTYTGDSLSDYEATCIVKAEDEKTAIQIAKKRVTDDGANNFRIDGIIKSYAEYKKKYPHSGFPIYEGVVQFNVVESADRRVLKSCKVLNGMLDEVNTKVRRKISQIQSIEDFDNNDSKVSFADLDIAKEKLNDFINYIMHMEV